MGSSGKKKTTMAKLARENRLRERRLDKQTRKDARKQAAADHVQAGEDAPEETVARVDGDDPPDEGDVRDPASAADPADEALLESEQDEREPSDPREKEVALLRLRDAPDEELALFEPRLQHDALEAGATERELRDAQRDHPGHGA
jgi:hypothetical protein